MYYEVIVYQLYEYSMYTASVEGIVSYLATTTD